MEHLTETYNHFEPNKAGFFTRLMEWIVGEKNKGMQETEKMLLVGVPFLAVGQVRVDGGSTIVEPPLSGHSYILTTLSRAGAVKALKAAAFNYKVAIGVLGVVGVGFVGLWYHKTYVKEKQE